MANALPLAMEFVLILSLFVALAVLVVAAFPGHTLVPVRIESQLNREVRSPRRR